MGSETSAVATTGGFSMDVPGGATGATVTPTGEMVSQGGGFGELLTQLLKDPEVMKALGGTIGKVGETIAAGRKIPPQAQQMIGRTLQTMGQEHQQKQRDMLNPYGGDMLKFMTPEMARGVLTDMGIPYGRMGI